MAITFEADALYGIEFVVSHPVKRTPAAQMAATRANLLCFMILFQWVVWALLISVPSTDYGRIPQEPNPTLGGVTAPATLPSRWFGH